MSAAVQTSFFQQSRDFDYEAKTARAYASMEQCHVGIGWLWWQVLCMMHALCPHVLRITR